MAKTRKKRKKIHVLKIDELHQNDNSVLIGIQTAEPLYRIAFDLNRFFHLNLSLNSNDLEVVRNKKNVFFENYLTPDDSLGQKIRLANNKVLQLLEHPVSLFDTHEAFYLFPELEMMDYILFIPISSSLNYQELKQNFKVSYPVQWIEVDLQQCYTAFPVFPG